MTLAGCQVRNPPSHRLRLSSAIDAAARCCFPAAVLISAIVPAASPAAVLPALAAHQYAFSRFSPFPVLRARKLCGSALPLKTRGWHPHLKGVHSPIFLEPHLLPRADVLYE